MKKDKNVILITGNFPYYPGEQFLEEEITYWSTLFSGKITILPMQAKGTPRNIPKNIHVDTVLAKLPGSFTFFFNRLRTLFSILFLKEVLFIFKVYRIKCPKCFLIAFRSIHSTYTYYYKLKKYLKGKGNGILIYSYWFDASAYASALLKRKQKVAGVISRAHRFEVYEDRRPYSYMPLKRQFKDDFDKIMAISKEGKDYLSCTYGIKKDNILISRLGVEVDKDMALPGKENPFVVVSVSGCVPVKRIDRIIEGIAMLAGKETGLQIEWHHIGFGPELDKLKTLAKSELSYPNVKWFFCGGLTNKEVRSFLKENKIDVFINTSESEGVPVSIMEAMSFGIPAIAPDIGGVSELVNSNNGILLSTNPDIKDIYQALSQVNHFRSKIIRDNAKAHIINFFNAKSNYEKFIIEVERIINFNDKPESKDMLATDNRINIQ